MTKDVPLNYEQVRRRFPWVGLVNSGDRYLSERYREIIAKHRPD
ncbi:hypothetical protein LUPAC06_06232 [Micromonospora saelicesensis]|nr:hypothetical protein [Micromonospora saelicesensis]RAO51547.1 hypothetical protein LUPAC06_06232 [Micromonospora saelicesensis]